MATTSTRTEVDYPESDGEPMGETIQHRDANIDLILALKDWFADDPLAYVSGDEFLYYVEGQPRFVVSPDVWFVHGIDKTILRPIYKTWLEGGKGPDFVMELTSPSTRRVDKGKKFRIYQDALKVREYFLFDPLDEYLDPVLQGYRLVQGEYRPIEPVDGRLPSEVLGLHLEADDILVRLFNPETGERLLNRLERLERQETENRALETEKRALETEKRTLEATTRAQEAEIDRLRRELEALRGARGRSRNRSGSDRLQPLARRLATAPRLPWPDEPVPVALVITDLDVGGAERALVALATGLDRRRWWPSVVALGGEGALAGPLREAGIAVECLDVDRRRPNRAVLALAGALRRSGPRLVQGFLFHANVVARLAAPWAGRPWVLGGLRVAERRRRWHLTLDRLTGPLATGSVCVSEGVRRFSVEVGRLESDRLVVIPNGVDPAPIDRAEPVDRASIGIPPGGFLALYVGRLDPQKGLTFLLDAASRVIPTRPDWHLALVGDGPESEALKSRIESDPTLRGRVHRLGRRDDVPGLLKAADLLVLPSLWEGMPNVVLEAMAARLAVVGTSVEGTEDLVVPGRTGWLVPPAEPDSLADALIEAAADPARLWAYGEAARNRVEAIFTPGRVVEAYERLWAGVLGLATG